MSEALMNFQLKEQALCCVVWPKSTHVARFFPDKTPANEMEASFWLGEYCDWLSRQPGMYFTLKDLKNKYI